MTENYGNLLENVFGNSLIADQITSYLSLEDMKMASLTCRAAHQMVRSSPHFSKITALRFTIDNKAHFFPNFRFFYFSPNKRKLSSWSWGLVEFDTKFTSEILPFLVNNVAILENIKTLRLTRNCPSGSHNNLKDMESLLRMIFDNCNGIVGLQIDLELLRKQDFRQLIQPEFAKGIKSLEIFSSDLPYHPNSSVKEKSLALQNLQHFSTTLEMKLENIVIAFDNYQGMWSMAIVDLLLSTRESLQSLILGFELRHCDFRPMQNIVFPNLKRVQFGTFESPGLVGVVEFLENQPPLVNLTAYFGMEFPKEFVEYLKNKTKSLQTLTLAALLLIFDSSFLADCSKLKEFVILQHETSDYWEEAELNVTGASLLTSLPPSVKKLCFSKLQRFWRDQNNLGGEPIPELRIISLLSRFPDMVHLDLSDCKFGDVTVTDLVVQTIIAQMPKLRELKFSAGSCTDFAITGIEDGQLGGISLTELTGLTHLSINNCQSISSAAVLFSVRHPTLQTLEYRQCNAMSPEQVEQLVSQNPSLHSLSLRVDGTKALLTKLQRTRHWTNLHLDGIRPSWVSSLLSRNPFKRLPDHLDS